MARVSIDTNCLLRFLLEDIPEQTAATEQLLKGANTVDVADMAIMELVYVLEKIYGFPRTLIAAQLRTIMSIGQINCNEQLLEKVLPLYSSKPAVSFVDCCLSVYAECNTALPLYTFDKKLATQLPGAELLQ